MFHYVPCGALYRSIPSHFLQDSADINEPVDASISSLCKEDSVRITISRNALDILGTSSMSLMTPGLMSSVENVAVKKFDRKKVLLSQTVVRQLKERSISTVEHRDHLATMEYPFLSLRSISDKPAAQAPQDQNDFLKSCEFGPAEVHPDDIDTTQCYQQCSNAFGLGLLQNYKMVMFLILMMGNCIAISAPIFLSALAQDSIGLDTSQVALLIGISSFSDIPIRPLCGALFDGPCLRNSHNFLVNLLCFIASGCIFCLPLMGNAWSFASIWIICQSTSSCIQVVQVGFLTDIVGATNLSKGIGLTRFAQGLGIMIGSTVGGLLKDTFGTYSYSFFVCGLIGILSSAFVFLCNLCTKLFCLKK